MNNIFYKLGKYNHKFFSAIKNKQTYKYNEYAQHKNKYLKSLLTIARQYSQSGGVNVGALDAVNAAIKEKVVALNASVESKDATIADLRRQVDDLTTQIASIRAEKTALEQDLTRVRSEMATLQADKQKLESEKKQLEDSQENLTASSQQLQSDIDQKNAEIAQKNSDIAQKDTQIQELTQQIQQKTAEITSLQERLTTSQAQKADVDRKYQQMYKHVLDLLKYQYNLLTDLNMDSAAILAMANGLGEREYVQGTSTNVPSAP